MAHDTRHARVPWHKVRGTPRYRRHSPESDVASWHKVHGTQLVANGTRHTAQVQNGTVEKRHAAHGTEARHSHVGARTAKIEGWTGSRSLEILETARGTTERGTNGTIQKRHRAQSKTAQLKVGVPWRNAARGTVAGDGTARKRHTAHKGPQYMVHRRLEQPTGYQYTAHIFYFEKTTPLFLTIPVRHVVFSADSQTFTRVSIYINKSTLRVNDPAGV
ncbi:hypothetical protein MGYG_09130 [Nannizzia gypsea CBS 118893]|uniref:Uncharacterized protein n=1 Tax=Arthroderma gypseum (strain ATCC MYA-4604 / CBS 118893) TaxID=535722 RepID=E4UZQ5_ARTGP|nr:hypothetical protein MGYG_09130 [Nannizzia gypsea CBS 118893]EFR03585.1 hypothetical protein MGYG_09130 [Nannizzia gypsea CBS 118893]